MKYVACVLTLVASGCSSGPAPAPAPLTEGGVDIAPARQISQGEQRLQGKLEIISVDLKKDKRASFEVKIKTAGPFSFEYRVRWFDAKGKEHLGPFSAWIAAPAPEQGGIVVVRGVAPYYDLTAFNFDFRVR